MSPGGDEIVYPSPTILYYIVSYVWSQIMQYNNAMGEMTAGSIKNSVNVL